MFNESQIGAISHHLGPAIILAGPGSGKTTVITHRIKNLIKEYNVPPEKILVVTFTKAAALHMEQRFLQIINDKPHTMQQNNPTSMQQIYPVTFGTFHSVYYKILRLTFNYSSNNIIGERERMEIITEITARLKIDVPSLQDFVNNVSSEISNVKGNMLDLESFQSVQCHKEDFQRLYNEYNMELNTLGKMDFDDILVRCYELLINYPDVLNKWQNTYDYILIDEFQDINRVQYEIIKLLSKPSDNLFIVGDDDQSIYGFRGAKPEIMHSFKEDYPNAKEILLNVNYRCCENIARWSQNLIENNKSRFEKDIIAVNTTDKISEVKQFKTQEEELTYVAQKIKEYIEKGINAEDIAILVRNNSQIPVISEALGCWQIKNKAKTQKNKLYESQVAKDIVSYVKAALTYDRFPIRDNEDVIRIINKPSRFISRQLVAKEGIGWEGLKSEYKGTDIGERINKLLFDFKIISMAKPFGAVNYIRNGVGYEDYLKEYGKEKGMQYTELIKQIDKIQQDASRYRSIETWIESIDERHIEEDKQNGVNILTMHSSKGLEFKVVFIVDANQGVVPSSKIIRDKEFEEERRVFYVAMTRASQILNIYGIKEVLGCEVQMSMFISEMLRINEN